MTKDYDYEFRLTLFECEIFSTRDEKEEVGPFRRHIVKHGRLGHTRHEPLYRHKDGNHWVHARFGERCCKRWHHRNRGLAWPHEYSGYCASVGRAKTGHLGTAGN